VRFRRWQVIVLVLAVGAIAAAGTYFLLGRRSVTTPDLVSLLPAANATLVYADVSAIRRAGILNMLAGSKASEEPEYRQFVDQTKFDYQQDLAAVAAAFREGQVFLAVRGRFRWKNLADYARHQGGSCHGNYCVMPGSRPDRRISFYPVKPDIMAMAIGPDDFAAYQVTQQSGRLNLNPPNQPVWALVPAAAFREPGVLPAGAKAYATALQNAEQALFTVGPENDHLQLGVEVTCRDAAAASALLRNLESITSTLRKLIAREHQQANPADLSGVLVGGTFHREDRRVDGQWPIPEAFVKAMTGGAL
jgi:hypothetical protein